MGPTSVGGGNNPFGGGGLPDLFKTEGGGSSPPSIGSGFPKKNEHDLPPGWGPGLPHRGKGDHPPGPGLDFPKQDEGDDPSVHDHHHGQQGGDLSKTLAGLAFKQLDTNKDGKLSSEEAAKSPDIYAKFLELDTDQNGSLNLEEFLKLADGGADGASEIGDKEDPGESDETQSAGEGEDPESAKGGGDPEAKGGGDPEAQGGGDPTAQGGGGDPTAGAGGGGLQDLLIQWMMALLDTNKDGKLSKSEASKIPGFAELFQKLDKDKSGTLDAKEIREGLTGGSGSGGA